ncbi:ComEC/Rec2 family competence protein [Desulfosporosinus sp. Sb-LF]|uniref:ComEC/Rec2 family competence protein n=1 Tax=Desulfosporosinus sp. Sb-LF TaxID=2560027 RepID=UPI00107F7FA0|nr:ComEC/Rec2 family competence protein [Desulfosporosinus sp. Sb-LF]TGE31593.1 MBL fold metallo-hydrolase [Desulfosporosinus sp. Sb-LF]
MKKRVWAGILLLSAMLLNTTACSKGVPTSAVSEPVSLSGKLTATFIDVGQGDATLIQAPSGKVLLIDGGPKDGEVAVLSTLKSKGIRQLSIIATHEDADHITALDNVVNTYDVDKVYLPKMPTKATVTMERFANAVKTKGLKFTSAKAGVSVDLGVGVTAVLLAPVKDTYDQDNNYSAVLKVSYGDTSFLFTGDAEGESERDMIASGANLKATVLKVGHHGSRSSSTDPFMKAVSPKYAVIEVGPNSYGHPTSTILNRLSSSGIKTYRTDQQGTVTAVSDGKSVTFTTEK